MWKIKVLTQFLLSKLPLGENINYWLQLVKQSHSEDKTKERVIDIINDLIIINKYIQLEGAIVVEIGTGWEAIGPVLLYLMGVKKCHTYDHVRHARANLLENLIKCIEAQLDEISKITTIPSGVLKRRLSKLQNGQRSGFFSLENIIYHAPGDASKTGLKDDSVDLVFSNAVLEHVPKKIITDLTIESKRILKNHGVVYHLIGLHDHYVSFDKKITKVNFLKYPESVWSFFVHNKISYHNRLREKQFLEIFDQCGGKIIWKESKLDSSEIAILRNMKIDKFFEGMTYEELAVYETKIIMSFPK